ncbi:MAG: plasmid pRiA4b ORF-3 family protein [Frankiaceae bacterium]|nr:plasmid pRiA4b ORF-3 family protein [Frankiaceae bacterium]
MPRRPPEQPSDLPPEVSIAIAAIDLDQLRDSTSQLIDLAGARARQRMAPVPQRRRRRRAKEPFGVTVRVDLVGATPPVWRRLVLPSTLRLDQLHGVLQAVFDWTDSHLHRFSLDDEAWGDGEKYLCPYDVEEGEDDGVPASEVRLDEVLAVTGEVLTYLYDYGDDWHHRRVVEEVGPAVDDVRLLAGHGAAPPEDSGGIWEWDAGAAPSWALAEAQAALAVWSATRSMPPELHTLQQQLYGTPDEAVLLEMLAAAGLDQPVAVDDDVAETATARYRWLLHRVGAGVKLTAAGWLPPALVTEAMDALWPEDRWIGKRNREDLTEPVRRLRASAQRTGLLRVSRGQLLATKTGTALRDDPHGLFRHLAERLPGRPRDAFARTAIPLVLVAVAAGRSHSQPVAELLTAAGWVTDGGGAVSPYAPDHAASDALEVLDVAGAWHDVDWRNRVVTPVGQALAHAALVSAR